MSFVANQYRIIYKLRYTNNHTFRPRPIEYTTKINIENNVYQA